VKDEIIAYKVLILLAGELHHELDDICFALLEG
jgi:hypothetical protein